jgi:hypothetical protein
MTDNASLSERILRIVYAFDVKDGRRADVRALAAEVAELEIRVAAAKYALQRTWMPTGDLLVWGTTSEGHNLLRVNEALAHLQEVRVPGGPDDEA